jgi:hypothetical protein
MAFGGKVDDGIELILFEEFFDAGFVGDIPFLKGVVGGVLNVFQVGEITGIGKRVEVDDMVLRILIDE